MNDRGTAKFRATAGGSQAFGATPQQALAALMQQVPRDATLPIVIWPYNQGDAFFSEAQQARLQELKRRHDTLTAGERLELEQLVAAAFDASSARVQAMHGTPPDVDPQAWLETVGMFRGDSGMERIYELGRAWRNTDGTE